MDEKPDQIIGQIEAQREELGRNLSELETRVRRTTDWRTYFDRNPMLMIGAALGGGIVLGSVVGTRRSHSRSHRWESHHTGSQFVGASAAAASVSSSPRRPTGPATSIQKAKINETVDHVKAALIAFGIAKAKEFLSQAVPGLEHHLGEAERAKQHSSGPSYSNYGSSHTGSQDFRSHTESPSYRSTPEPVGSPSGMP